MDCAFPTSNERSTAALQLAEIQMNKVYTSTTDTHESGRLILRNIVDGSIAYEGPDYTDLRYAKEDRERFEYWKERIINSGYGSEAKHDKKEPSSSTSDDSIDEDTEEYNPHARCRMEEDDSDYEDASPSSRRNASKPRKVAKAVPRQVVADASLADATNMRISAPPSARPHHKEHSASFPRASNVEFSNTENAHNGGPSRRTTSIRTARQAVTVAPQGASRKTIAEDDNPFDTSISAPVARKGKRSAAPSSRSQASEKRKAERRLKLERDVAIVTGSVHAYSVRCGGCGIVIILDTRRTYYDSNWKKHKCTFVQLVRKREAEPLQPHQHRCKAGYVIPLSPEQAQVNEEKMRTAEREGADNTAIREFGTVDNAQ